MERDLKPRNDSDINSADYDRLVKLCVPETISSREKRVFDELKKTGKNTLTRQVIFEKIIIYNKEDLRKYHLQRRLKKISSLVQVFSSTSTSAFFTPSNFGNIDLDTSNVESGFEEVIEYYNNLNKGVIF